MAFCSNNVLKFPTGGNAGPIGETGDQGTQGVQGIKGIDGLTNQVAIKQPLKFVKLFQVPSTLLGDLIILITEAELQSAGLLKESAFGTTIFPEAFDIRICIVESNNSRIDFKIGTVLFSTLRVLLDHSIEITVPNVSSVVGKKVRITIIG